MRSRKGENGENIHSLFPFSLFHWIFHSLSSRSKAKFRLTDLGRVFG